MAITFDFETKSFADLTKVGAWAYSQHPTTQIICAAYGIDDKEIQTWWPGKKLKGVQAWPNKCVADYRPQMPYDLYLALRFNQTIEAHNVAFERSAWTNIMVPQFDWLDVQPKQWLDTMAVACYYALPAKLDMLLRALHFQGKDPDGNRLITKYSKLYLKTAKEEIPQDDFDKFVAYCVQDVKCEQSVSDYLGPLPDRELPVFHLDQAINLRGLYLDVAGIKAAIQIVEERSAELTKEFVELVGLRPTQRERLLEWFEAEGLILENMQKAYLEELLEDGEIPQGPARRALEIRLAINKASTKKLDAMMRQIENNADRRARFQTRYHGAATGRWTGGGFQPLNLNRGFDDVSPDQLVRDIMYRSAKWLDCLYGDAMGAVGKASRHWIMAEPGNQIYAGDYTSIEAIILAVLAGEQWKIDAFANGEKIYERTADKIYKLPKGTVKKKTHPNERKDGKTCELAFGYQGALGAWLKFDSSGRHSDEQIIAFCKAWRAEHPMIVKLWENLQRCAIKAVRTGKKQTYRMISFEPHDNWLSMILPNGKRIWYWKPQVRIVRPHWCHPETKEKCRDGTCGHDHVPQLSYMSRKDGQWKRVTTYGGKLTENACQATSREILVPAMMRCENAGYHVILTVYDEIVSETKKGFGTKQEFTDLMAGPLPDWAEGWPISVDAWVGDRYKK